MQDNEVTLTLPDLEGATPQEAVSAFVNYVAGSPDLYVYSVTMGDGTHWLVDRADGTTVTQTAATKDTAALNRINAIVSAPTWSVGMLEDICEIVRGTGRVVVESDYIAH